MQQIAFALSLSAAAMALATGTPPRRKRPSPDLALELNAAQPSQKGCRLTFVVTNNLGEDLNKAAFEIALFNEAWRGRHG